MYALEWKVRALWKESFVEGTPLLRTFFQQCGQLGTMSPGMVSKLLHCR